MKFNCIIIYCTTFNCEKLKVSCKNSINNCRNDEPRTKIAKATFKSTSGWGSLEILTIQRKKILHTKRDVLFKSWLSLNKTSAFFSFQINFSVIMPEKLYDSQSTSFECHHHHHRAEVNWTVVQL